jgi:hypothetical protein
MVGVHREDWSWDRWMVFIVKTGLGTDDRWIICPKTSPHDEHRSSVPRPVLTMNTDHLIGVYRKDWSWDRWLVFIMRTGLGTDDRCSSWGLVLGQMIGVHREDWSWDRWSVFIVRTGLGTDGWCSSWGLVLGQMNGVHREDWSWDRWSVFIVRTGPVQPGQWQIPPD